MRYQHFLPVAASGIPIILFIDEASKEGLEIPANANVHMVILNFDDLYITQMTRRVGSLVLPGQRCMKKDTTEFMMLMHAKIELMIKAIEINPFGTDYFAWMDFSLGYIFKTPEQSIQKLQQLSRAIFQPKLFVIPGCWEKGVFLNQMWDRILWRFCGGFFIADKESLLYLYEMYMDWYPILLQDSKKMTWETNVWAWLEQEKGWTPDWFLADHNDSMIDIPRKFYRF
jgi:hypothetical protein